MARIAKNRGCRLADEVDNADPGPVEVMLGSNAIGRIQILKAPKRLLPGLVACPTLFGWVLSGDRNIGEGRGNGEHAIVKEMTNADLENM